MLARSPEARQRDAGVALEDLLALQPEREAQRRFRRLVAAMLLAAVAGGGALWHRSTRPVTVKLDGQSIAVLPFEDLSPGKERTTVAAGLAAEIHDALAEVRGLRVAGHGSAVRTRGLDVREAASKLQVSSVLKGTLRSHGEGLEVVVRLLRGADARELWSRTFAVSTEAGAFEIQKAIASALIQALGLQQASSTAGAADRPPLPDAYARYLRARSVYGAEGTDDADAIADLRAAVQLDPSFARAWTLLGNAIYTSLPYGPIETETAYAERCNGALGALDRALALDSHLGEAYSSRGYVRVQCNMDWDGATADLARGLELEPGSAEAWRRSGVTELYRARLEPALRSLRRAVDLDPLLTKNWTWLARVYWGLGRYAEARAAVDRTLAMTPSSWVVVLPAFFDLEEGRPAEALEQFKKATSVNQRMRGQALALWDLGRKDEARAVVAEMIRQDLVLPYGLAQIHSWWGENDRALEALERQLASRKYPSIEARWDPLLRKLHADPRFWVLLRRAGFPE